MTKPPTKARGFAAPDDLDSLFQAKLRESGLDLADAKALGYEFLEREETHRLKLPIWAPYRIPSLALPYYDPCEKVNWNFIRYRFLLPPAPEPDKFPKYIQPKNSPLHAYFPTIRVAWKKVFADPTKAIIITEGELKAACATKLGFPTIGLGGVDSFASSKMGYDLLPDLEVVPWETRIVYICYDSDADHNPSMILARQRLANELLQRGAVVYMTQLPQLGKGKTGLDDFLVAQGANAFQQVLDDAAKMSVEWRLFYQAGTTGPIGSLANVMVALRHAPELKDVFHFDDMGKIDTVHQRLPEDGSNQPMPRRFTDTDIVRVQEWLQKHGDLVRIGPEVVLSGIQTRSQEQIYHPVRDYLHGLTWDKTERLPSWLHHAFGAAVTPYTAAIGVMFLISMIARVMSPGCKVDYMLVLEGFQGEAKSAAWRVIADQWFSDNLPALDGDQVRLSAHLAGKWVIEIAELGAMKKADVEDVKKFLTRQEEIYIPKYRKVEVLEPRQCVFVGTTNEDTYLRDETGNRRFWPVATTKVDLAWLRKHRDQLLAEALVRYNRGEQWWPERDFENEHIKPEQEARFAGGDWDDEVMKFTELRLKATHPPETCRVTPKEIAIGQLGFEPRQAVGQVCKNIAGGLRRLGWERAPRSNGASPYMPGPKVLAKLAAEREVEPAKKAKVVPIKKPAGKAKY